MKAAGAPQKKRLSLLLLSAGLLFGISVGPVSAQDYYKVDSEEESYESSEMFFYDYADEEGPSAPPEPTYSGNGESQLIIISPPEDAWQDPRIHVEPVRAHDHAPQQDPIPAKIALPVRADNHPPRQKIQITPSDRPIAPVETKPTSTDLPARAHNHAPQPTYRQKQKEERQPAPIDIPEQKELSGSEIITEKMLEVPVVKSPPEITPGPEKTVLRSRHSDVVHSLNVAPPVKIPAKKTAKSTSSRISTPQPSADTDKISTSTTANTVQTSNSRTDSEKPSSFSSTTPTENSSGHVQSSSSLKTSSTASNPDSASSGSSSSKPAVYSNSASSDSTLNTSSKTSEASVISSVTAADSDLPHKPDQKDKVAAIADSSFQKPVTKTDSVANAEKSSTSVQAPIAAPVRADNHPPQQKPQIEPATVLPVREFIAEPTAGKPVVDPAGKMVHFYSDPAPLVMEPPPDPNYDPDFADFEKSRILPVINAPDGIYGFNYEGEGIQIAASHTWDGIQIKAGDVVALNMLITNNTTLKRIFTENVNAPEGVRGVHEIAAFEINPGETVSRRVSFHIDSSMAAGEHKVGYRVTCRTSPKISGELKFGFAIRALPRLAFEIASAAPLIENAPFKATGRIINSGNTGLNVQLSIKGRQKNLQVTPSRISLPAGGHAFVEIEGTTPVRQHPLDDVFDFELSAITDKVSGSLQLLKEPVKLRIASKQ